MDWAVSDLAEGDVYKLLCNTVMPRPIALVTTIGLDGAVNAAPFAFFNIFSHAPPLVVLGIDGRGPKDGRRPALKDTVNNIRDTGEFVVNLVERAMLPAVNECAVDHASGVDELAMAGLTALPSRDVAPPRIAQSPVHLECRETMSLAVGRRQRVLVLGEIVRIWTRDGVTDENLHVDPDKLDIVGRVHGSDWYVSLRDRFQVPRG